MSTGSIPPSTPLPFVVTRPALGIVNKEPVQLKTGTGFYNACIEHIRKLYGPGSKDQWKVTLTNGSICLTPKGQLLGGSLCPGGKSAKGSVRINGYVVKVQRSFEWNDGKTVYPLILEQEGSWFRFLSPSLDPDEAVRSRLIDTITERFHAEWRLYFTPFDTQEIARIYIPLCDKNHEIIDRLISILNGQSKENSIPFEMMQVDQAQSPEPMDFESVSQRNLMRWGALDKKRLLPWVTAALGADRICLYHFFSKKTHIGDQKILRDNIVRRGLEAEATSYFISTLSCNGLDLI